MSYGSKCLISCRYSFNDEQNDKRKFIWLLLMLPTEGIRFFLSHMTLENNLGTTAPPTTEANKGRQPSALDISSLGTYLGANRGLYAQSHLRGQ
ncbi:hypothetical protein AVEN_110433-1 [Araneus ventricosus]|uniref:Uncharacterized protein n=1 Tax=Araneus ventricosus TaxID=182803 RepID=A0A4Y2KGC4_ARAVE|nr:hypothetical protein AVEN_110433-1 [Araneus ventricosus]